MNSILIGNLCSLLAMVADAASASRKTARGMLLVQTVSQVFYGLGSAVLKGYSAVVQNFVSALRNLFALQSRQNKYIEWALIALALGLGILFNNRGVIGLLPVVANLEYSLAVFKFKEDEYSLKIAFLINAIMFCIFNTVILNIVGAISNVVVSVMTVFFLLKAKKDRR